MNAIQIENLVRDYGGGKGVFDLSFHVNQGKLLASLARMEPERRRRYVI